MTRRHLLAGGLTLALAAALLPTAIAASDPADPPEPVAVRILAINDFHGNLEPPEGSSGQIDGVDAGGVEYLATHLAALGADDPGTIVVTAGDLIGASPPLSGLFHDEPTIDAMELIGLDASAIGNHELDEGAAELHRMQDGGCNPTDGCAPGTTYDGADFPFLAANVLDAKTGKLEFPAYRIVEVAGVKVGLVGVVTRATPDLVLPSGIAGLRFIGEAKGVNQVVPTLRKKGVEAIVVLIHEGGWPTGDYDTCEGVSGPIVQIVEKLDPAVDLVISGHTHQAYRCVIDGKVVTSAKSFGRMVTKIDLQVDPVSGEIVTIGAENLVVTRDVDADPDQTALIAQWNTIVGPVLSEQVGTIDADIDVDQAASGESAMGDLVADSRLLATQDEAGATIAFISTGSVREGLEYAVGTPPGTVTYGDLYAIQPWGNNLVTVGLTGAQIDAVLEQQFDNPSEGENRFLQVSTGFAYAWSASAPTGERIDSASITLNGTPLDPDTVYRVTIDPYLAGGGDNFSAFTQGTDQVGGILDVDALKALCASADPYPTPTIDRITALP
ncbi:MAG: bifunctional metallophosphatase/5'-nucleotidase [Chloroflexota bacterium]